MTCECINTLEEKALNQLKESGRFKKPIEKVSMQGISFPIDRETMTMTTRTANMLEITLEGQKKKEKMSMIHTYCPYCGVEYS